MPTTKSLAQSLALMIGSIAVTLILLEMLVRSIGHIDADGQFSFLERRILPYRLQAHQHQENLEQYLATPEKSSLLYDAKTGWIINPSREDVNSLGMHTIQEYERTKQDGVIRIALFGDSFTAGDEVTYNETWASVLEQCLLQRGLNVELLNFGVSAYGMDQAYLRYLDIGQAFTPDIVVFGFQYGNMYRNLSAFRPIIGGTLPFSKPHFILEGDTLVLLNQPTIPPNELISVYSNFESHPLVQHESLYNYRYHTAWWSGSKFFSLIAYLLWDERYEDEAGTYHSENETTRLASRIIESFGAAAETNGSRFVIVHLAPRGIVQATVSQQALPYAFMLDALAQEFPVFRPELAFPNDDDGYWMKGGHYSFEGNTIIANALCKDFQAEITPPLP